MQQLFALSAHQHPAWHCPTHALFSLFATNSSFLDWMSISPVKCTVTPEQVLVLIKCIASKAASFVEGSLVYPSKTRTAVPYLCFTWLTYIWHTSSYMDPWGHGRRWSSAPPSRTYWTSSLGSCCDSWMDFHKALATTGLFGCEGREDDSNNAEGKQ